MFGRYCLFGPIHNSWTKFSQSLVVDIFLVIILNYLNMVYTCLLCYTPIPHRRVFQHKARLRGPKGEDVRVGTLLRSHGGVVHTDINSGDQCAGQTVSDQVGLTSHMLNVRSKLQYGRQLKLLARAPRIGNLGHSKGQRLMVSVCGKTATLKALKCCVAMGTVPTRRPLLHLMRRWSMRSPLTGMGGPAEQCWPALTSPRKTHRSGLGTSQQSAARVKQGSENDDRVSIKRL